ncbi:glycosyltransferase family 4 protein [Hyphomonas sp. CY54-11-8]|uniref:glycosyltransferase family 4 protein n=1 Tax=Hyphomonas sp. CY54-11-8 TaxID=1280944 RepID=UPI0018CC24C1|nr:glycosyltransferase family 4 protein [Hyphomonas sp. CY54-11-8]
MTIDPPRFLVVQYGARHNYAIPEAFFNAGALAGLYTDLTATTGIGRQLSRTKIGRQYLSKQLARRTPPNKIEDFVHSWGTATIAGELARKFIADAQSEHSGYFVRNAIAESLMVQSGTLGATHIYSMFGEGGRFLSHAKRAGLKIIGDVFIAPSADLIVAKEAMNFPDWVDATPKLLSRDDVLARHSALLTEADLLVCPSKFVRDDIVKNYGVAAEKTIICPYAVDQKWLGLEAQPEPGRVYFAGTANLRKGIHYLAEAATLLKDACQVFVAGNVSARVRNHPKAIDLNFLGHLGPSEMANEMARADVFVLPSLAEGSASVTAEALGVGVPVVTTAAAGSIVRHGIDGLIVSERAPKELAEAIRSIVNNRKVRDKMGAAARERAKQFTWERFALQVISSTCKPLAEAPKR